MKINNLPTGPDGRAVAHLSQTSHMEPCGEQFCTNCMRNRPKAGGTWIVPRHGKTRRWKCAICVKAAKRREGKCTESR